MKKKYGLKTSKEWLEGEYNGSTYLHDAPSSTYLPYCYAYDLTRLATEGLFFLTNYNEQPPKHLTTFIDDVIEYISYMSNRSSGAVGIPNVLIWTYYFWKKDCENNYIIKDKEYYIRQSFQKLIYRLNQPFMRIDQTAFVNISVFDRNYIESLFGGVEYPDGSYVIDFVDELIEHQKVFMEVVSEIRSENMFTFPVLTYSLLYKDGKFVDESFARWCSDHNTQWNDSNFFISDNVGTLSNCPLSGDTKILYWSEYYKEYKLSDIKSVFHDKRDDKRIKVLSNGKEINCRINKFDIPIEYEITLANNASIKTTASHLNKVLGKDYVASRDLTTDDYLPYSLTPYDQSNNMTYEEGKLVGMFLGDGSYTNESQITFSLHRITGKDDIKFLYDYCKDKYCARFNETICISKISGKDLCVNVSINSEYLRGLINQFVLGDNALNKQLSYRFLNCSMDFRRGILDGIYTTDGGNSNRIYTSSEASKDSLVVLLASMGMVASVNEDNREGRLGDNTNYCVRYYTPNIRKKLKDVYEIDDEYMWVKIKSIVPTKKNARVSYCLEVLDDNVEPIFMLGNGVVTHNCRLLSDSTKLDAFINSIGGTALSIGSVKVNTINLMRIAYETEQSQKKFLSLLKKRVLLCCKTLDCVRHIISRNVEKGLLPNYCDGGIELSKQYCTVGILGLYEVIEHFGFIQEDEFGYKSYTEDGISLASEIFNVINDVKDNFTKEYSFNVESVPAERCAIVLCQKDNLIYGTEKDKFIYSNQWIPLSEKCTLKEKLRLSSILDVKCSGGAIAHIDIQSNFPNNDSAWEVLQNIAQSNVMYFAFNSKINVCKNRHGFVGTDICPSCGERVYDTYQRIVGYLVPTKSYSKDRFKEFNTRRWYEYSEMLGDL